MKEIVKQHPLRPIILSFELDKPVLEFEKKGLHAHYLMHDLTWDMLQQLKSHNQELEEIDYKITELEYLLLPIEQDLDILEVFLQIQDPSVLPFDEKDDDVQIDIDLAQFYKGVEHHSQRMKELHNNIMREYNWFQAHFDMIYDKESWIDSPLWDDIHDIYRNYKQAQVDIITLDRDQEEFRGVLSEVFDFQQQYMEYGETLFGAYNELQKRSDENYRRTENVNSALNDLSDS